VIEGEYHWHKHDEDDEFFYVVEGKLLIDLEGRTVELGPRQGFVVPKTVLHRTRAPRAHRNPDGRERRNHSDRQLKPGCREQVTGHSW
jgi:mannose-6-phosphate isomerase-like protein (cupin superfamily)